jgi:hypothetical protein
VQLTGHHRVHADALGGVLHGQHARKLDDAGLRRGIGHLGAAGPAHAGRRCNVDDAARALLDHRGQHVLAGEEHALEVEVDLGVPDVLGHLHGPAGRGTADFVDQDVDGSEALQARAGHPGHRLRRRHVAGVGNDRFACGAGEREGLLQASRVAVHREHAGAFLGKSHRDRASVAPASADAAGARDDGDLVLETKVHDSKR